MKLDNSYYKVFPPRNFVLPIDGLAPFFTGNLHRPPIVGPGTGFIPTPWFFTGMNRELDYFTELFTLRMSLLMQYDSSNRILNV